MQTPYYSVQPLQLAISLLRLYTPIVTHREELTFDRLQTDRHSPFSSRYDVDIISFIHAETNKRLRKIRMNMRYYFDNP